MSILRINSANPGVKRPLKVEDLANLWEGIESALAQGTDGKPRIICGFDTNDYDELEPGIIAFNGHLYMYDASSNTQVGSDIYAAEISTGDTRVLGDGTTQIFSYARVITDSSTAPGAVLIGEATLENLEAWKAPLVIPGSFIITNMIRDLAITASKLADDAVTGRAIADESITGGKLADSTVGTMQLAPSAVTQFKMDYVVRPCLISSMPFEFSPSSSNLQPKLSDLMISPSISGQGVWETKILKIVNIATSGLMLTVALNNLGSSYEDMPAIIPIMVSHTNPDVSITVRFSYPDPIEGGIRFTVPYTLQDGKGMQVMLAKCSTRPCYLPISVIQEA